MARRQRAKVEPGVTISDRGAVWVKFPEKPEPELLGELKACGFRFKRHQIAWVNKATEANVQVAETVWEQFVLREDA